MARFAAGEADKAVEWTRRAQRENVGMTWADRDLAAFLGAAGRADEARAAVRRLLASHPDTTVSRVAQAIPFMHDGLKARFLDGLRKAGLPE